MHARSTTFKGMPDRVNAGLEMIMDEVRPALDATDGCVGMSCLADREGGEVIVTTSWDSHPAMRMSQEGLMDLRMQVSQAMGGSMHIDEWTISMMHHGEHATCARAEWIRGDVDRLIEACRDMCMPDLMDMVGFCGLSLLTNKESNLSCVTTSFLDMPALIESRRLAEHLRDQAMPDAGAMVMRTMEYDLPYAHLNVPELV